ncbi:hypothetical protein QBC41DRAFT_134044 [Cercophora samala]|uniref:CFEM domain-containing protein n=1 Tax=Cercophora samala TaxID=330535 RepID=A0AA39ZBJ8_9PEZI|nr:hypothetical protein QBC41DRAFT_134044 [Cercophora samala]
MHLHTTIPLVVFLARASAQLHRMEFSHSMPALAAADCPATADMPKCAISCIDTATTQNGCASASDLVCQCKNYDAIQKAAAPCVIAACAAKAPDVISVASEICSQCAGVPVAAVMRETMAMEDAAAHTGKGENTLQRAAQPTGPMPFHRGSVENQQAGRDLWVDAERKEWVTMPRVAAGALARETGRPMPPRGVVNEDGDRKKGDKKMPRDVMLNDMTQAERKPLEPIVINSESPEELPDFGSDKSEGPELPDFGSDKSTSPELPDFGGEPTELRPCWQGDSQGSGSMRSCDGSADREGDSLEGDEGTFARTRSNTWKRKIDLVYEKEQERMRQMDQMKKEKQDSQVMMEKEEGEMNKQGEQMKWTW